MSFSEGESLSDQAPIRKVEEEPEKINWFFVKTGKSVPPGVLHSHNSHFKFYRAGKSKDGVHLYFTCSEKKNHGCLARATVEVQYPEAPDEDSPCPDPVPVKLVEVSTPEYHSQWHTGDNSRNIAHQILQIMKKEVEKNPCNKIGECFFYFPPGLVILILRANGSEGPCH